VGLASNYRVLPHPPRTGGPPSTRATAAGAAATRPSAAGSPPYPTAAPTGAPRRPLGAAAGPAAATAAHPPTGHAVGGGAAGRLRCRHHRQAWYLQGRKRPAACRRRLTNGRGGRACHASPPSRRVVGQARAVRAAARRRGRDAARRRRGRCHSATVPVVGVAAHNVGRRVPPRERRATRPRGPAVPPTGRRAETQEARKQKRWQRGTRRPSGCRRLCRCAWHCAPTRLTRVGPHALIHAMASRTITGASTAPAPGDSWRTATADKHRGEHRHGPCS